MEENKAYQKVIDYIKNQLEKGKISVGDKLPTERELSLQLNCSRNAIREAVKKLENLGIIQTKQGSGNYLVANAGAHFSEALSMMVIMKKVSSFEISQLRRSIELQTIVSAIEHATQEDIDYLEKILKEMKKCSAKRERELDREFHYKLVKISQNTLMIAIISALSESIDRFLKKVLKSIMKENKEVIDMCHREILNSIIEKDAVKGREALSRHYDTIDRELIRLPE